MQTKQDIKQALKTLKAFLKVSIYPKNQKELTLALKSNKVHYIIDKEELNALKVTIDLLSDCI